MGLSSYNLILATPSFHVWINDSRHSMWSTCSQEVVDKKLSFGDRLLIKQAVQTYPNLFIHKKYSICNHMMGEQMIFKAYEFCSLWTVWIIHIN